MSELTLKTINELREGFRAGDFSAREIAEAFNAAVAAARSLNAFTVETPELALEAADAADLARTGMPGVPGWTEAWFSSVPRSYNAAALEGTGSAWLAVDKPGVTTMTSAVRGLFRESQATRSEAMSLILGR